LSWSSRPQSSLAVFAKKSSESVREIFVRKVWSKVRQLPPGSADRSELILCVAMRVLAMECKDLEYNKTIGQVAEQLSDFRGELRSDGKPDHLKKHLDRLDVLNVCKAEVGKFLKLPNPIQLEAHLVFRNLVAMKFAWEWMASKAKLSFTELDRL
jgi:hypothetical protein